MKEIFSEKKFLLSGSIGIVLNSIKNMQEFGTLGNFIKFQKEIEDVRSSKKPIY